MLRNKAVPALFWVFVAVLGQAQDRKFQVSLAGGILRQFESGSVDDYRIGENDFPVTPPHSPPSLSLGLAYFFTRSVGLEYEGRFVLASTVVSKDPSDGDTLKFKTAGHFAMTLSLIVEASVGKLRPYIVAGGGLDRMEARSESWVTEFGYEIHLETPPEGDLLDPSAHLGVGLRIPLFRAGGLRIDCRYVHVFDELKGAGGIAIVGGVYLRI